MNVFFFFFWLNMLACLKKNTVNISPQMFSVVKEGSLCVEKLAHPLSWSVTLGQHGLSLKKFIFYSVLCFI